MPLGGVGFPGLGADFFALGWFTDEVELQPSIATVNQLSVRIIG